MSFYFMPDDQPGLVICSCDQQPDKDNLNGETAYLDSILEFLPIVLDITDSRPMVWPEYP